MGDFGHALAELKRGHRIRRQPWPHDSWLQLARRTADGKDAIAWHTEGQQVPFTLAMLPPGLCGDLSLDLLAEDWQVDYQQIEHKHRWSTRANRLAVHEMACDVIACRERLTVLPGARVYTDKDDGVDYWRLGPDGAWVDEDHDGHRASWEYLTSEHTLHLAAQGETETTDA